MRRWPLVAGAVALSAAWARPFRVEVAGGSMTPTLRDGDWLVATRRGRVRRGSVVVVRHPGRSLDLVKRVAGVPGDRVGDRTLGPGEYLVVGDHPSASTDGRTFGTVGPEAIEGVVRFRYRPRPRLIR
jgi:nickel-type superoxide dismutase maturation protease